MPKTVCYKDVFFCHGTPDSDETYLLEKLDDSGCHSRPNDKIAELTRHVQMRCIVCGHSHLPKAVFLPDGKLVVNPGSAGMPSYHDNEPVDHKMESLTPHAKYIVLSEGKSGWDYEHVAVSYDWEKSARIAEANGRPDWAFFIRTGRA